MPNTSRRESRRERRRVENRLPRTAPPGLLRDRAERRQASRDRIVVAAEAVFAADGSWPTFELVLKRDPLIRPATLGRNADALDDVRARWIAANGPRADWPRKRSTKPKREEPRTIVGIEEAKLRRQLSRIENDLQTERSSHQSTRGQLELEREMRRRAAAQVREEHAPFMNEPGAR